MSRVLRLDFLSQGRRAAPLGVGLLILGLGATVGAIWQQHRLAEDASALEARIADFRKLGRRDLPALKVPASDAKLLREEIREANKVLAQLTHPWDELFRELESSAMPGISLLAIQPDVAAGQVRITGEAKTYALALDYVRRLEASERLANVFLTSHEVRTTAPQRPVAFGVVADWVAPR